MTQRRRETLGRTEKGFKDFAKLNFRIFHYFYKMNVSNRISIDPNISHGKPTIRGMRWPVEVVLDLIASGMSFDQIIADHPELEKEDLIAALEFAKQTISGTALSSIAAG
jgi:uncharacterized protein (DUF433 family)